MIMDTDTNGSESQEIKTWIYVKWFQHMRSKFSLNDIEETGYPYIKQ